MRAMNAADAAAYSGAVWQARTLNFQAYMNRAMIVNEVTIAQSVSLRSWINYLAKLVDNINIVAKAFPPVGVVVQKVAMVLNTIEKKLQITVPPLEDALRVISLLEHDAQKVFNLSGAVVGQDLAREVAKMNGAELTAANELWFAKNIYQWVEFTETYTKLKRPSIGSKDDGRKRLREVALYSRDGFTRERDWNLYLPPYRLRKQGGTDLIDYDSWKGMDSVAVCPIIFGCKPALPLGWGGAQAHSTVKAVGKVGKHGDINSWGDLDGRLARRSAITAPNAHRFAAMKKYLEFPDYRDIQNFDTKNPKANTLPFSVEVVIRGKNLPSTSSAFGAKSILIDGKVIDHDPQNIKEGGVYATAEACVTFERPFDHRRLNGIEEFPSLFNPYWRASLATENRDFRVFVDAVKGSISLSRFPMKGGSCGL